jgi:imidazolonepropionase-like amidohydrolase
MKRILLFYAAIFFCALLNAQNPVPAPTQKAAILIYGATAHLGDGTVIPVSAIAFENGKLTMVADATVIRFDRSKYAKIFDASGKHVYPGFIAPNTQLGLIEIDAAKATLDVSDVGAYNPQLRSIVAYNTDSEILPTIRSNGVLLAQVTPAGGTLSGSSSVVQLDAWNWEDAAIRTDDGIHLNWPGLPTPSGLQPPAPDATRQDPYERDVQQLGLFFEAAQAYAKQQSEVKNLKFEAMRGLFDHKTTLYIHTGNVKTIRESVLFAEKYDLQPVLVGANDAWMLADFLKTHNIAVILSPTQRLPSRDDEDVDQPFKTAAQLHEKGVLIAFSDKSAWQQRNVAFQAGQAVGFGLPKEAAVQALTLNTARILGIADRCGSLAIGKDATLFISEGDALDMRSCQVTAAFIQGREINLDNKHKQLYRRFEAKYKQ